MTDFDDRIPRPCRHEQDLAAGSDRSVEQTHQNDNAAVIVILAVKNERFQRSRGISFRSRYLFHYALEHIVNIDAELGGDLRSILRGDPDYLLHFVLCPLRICGRKIDLVYDGNDLKIIVKCKIGVGKRLRLDALRCVDDQDRPFAGGKRAAHFIVEVHMARRVDEIERIGLSVRRAVAEADSPCLDRDPALLFKVHVVEDLVFHDPFLDRAAFLDDAVRQRGLAVVYMCDNRKVSYMPDIDHNSISVS